MAEPRLAPLLLVIGLAACIPYVEYRTAMTPQAAPEPKPAPVRILSASLIERAELPTGAKANSPEGTEPEGPEPEGRDGPPADEELARADVVTGTLLVVFSKELDPATIAADAFMVSLSDGRRLFPVAAVLSPASEGDENRSVALEGAFGDRENPPVAVHVRGRVYAESGEPTRGAGGTVRGFEERDSMVAAESRTVNAGSCPGAQAVVRTYWSDHLRGVDAEDLSRIAVVLRGGKAGAGVRTHPVGFDDHEVDDESREDNVLDLCLDVAEPIARVEVAADAFVDRGGTPTASAGVEVEPPTDAGEPP